MKQEKVFTTQDKNGKYLTEEKTQHLLGTAQNVKNKHGSSGLLFLAQELLGRKLPCPP